MRKANHEVSHEVPRHSRCLNLIELRVRLPRYQIHLSHMMGGGIR